MSKDEEETYDAIVQKSHSATLEIEKAETEEAMLAVQEELGRPRRQLKAPLMGPQGSRGQAQSPQTGRTATL